MIGRLALLFALALPLAHAAPQPYDEKADAKADVQRALSDAKSSGMPVLVIFGANWCQDCRALDQALSTGKNAGNSITFECTCHEPLAGLSSVPGQMQLEVGDGIALGLGIDRLAFYFGAGFREVDGHGFRLRPDQHRSDEL